jgi:tetratricopeptide (TPR) repeat protein
MKIENEFTFKKALSDGVNLFLGSGFPVLAKSADGRLLPTGRELLIELKEQFPVEYAHKLNLAQLCTILESKAPQEFHNYLHYRFTVADFDVRYHNLNNVYVKTIFTTNVDDLLYEVYASSTNQYLNDIDINGPVFNDRKAIDMVALHGSVVQNKRPLVFSVFNISTAFREDPDRWYFLSRKIQEYPTLFWGYNLDDAGVLEALSPKTIQGRPQKDKWIAMTDYDEGVRNYFQALGFQIIETNTTELLDFLGDLKTPPTFMKPTGKRLTTRELFPQEALPDIATIPARPIIEFYLGAAPSWQDVYAGRLHSTAHCATIRNLINAGKNTIVIGMAACGKTTLMMQVAMQLSSDRHILVCESLTYEQAQLIINTLAGQPAVIFVDNFTDRIDTCRYLMQHNNVIVVGFDRDYNFDIVAHRIDTSHCQIIEVSELQDRDISEIISRIPANIRSPYAKSPELAPGRQASLFDVIEANITRPTLNTRFRSVLVQIEQQDIRLLDILLAGCYTHSCRTVMSMDMLIAFLRDVETDYRKIYEMCRNLGSMITEYYGPLADEEQDYWTPHSTLMAEAVLNQASPESLRRILIRFHKNVSPYRIPRYDVFRKLAYNANLFVKAFPDWREGKEFYDRAYFRDSTPYLRQQGAIYLAHKKRFDDAFAWIDEAVTQSGGKIWSILNSHAVILFKANIGRSPTDPTVQRTLQKSMDILSGCYIDDKRKTYHALTFADQAIQYYGIYNNAAALAYLETAKQWLAEEVTRSPWNKHVKQLYSEISSILPRRGN